MRSTAGYNLLDHKRNLVDLQFDKDTSEKKSEQNNQN
jgi:hypothetical protein